MSKKWRHGLFCGLSKSPATTLRETADHSQSSHPECLEPSTKYPPNQHTKQANADWFGDCRDIIFGAVPARMHLGRANRGLRMPCLVAPTAPTTFGSTHVEVHATHSSIRPLYGATCVLRDKPAFNHTVTHVDVQSREPSSYHLEGPASTR